VAAKLNSEGATYMMGGRGRIATYRIVITIIKEEIAEIMIKNLFKYGPSGIYGRFMVKPS
jgi:hypothetical protein